VAARHGGRTPTMPLVGGPRATSISVPDELAASHARYFGAAGRRWIATLPHLVAERVEAWQLGVDGPPAFGAVALVVPVARADGTPAALKLQPVDDETGGEPDALRAWGGQGAVRLLEHDPTSGSLLLERLDASRSLAAVPDDLEALETIAGLLAELHAAPPPAGMRRLVDVAAAMLDDVPATLAGAAAPAERALVDACAARVTELLEAPIAERLLTDVLGLDRARAAGWTLARVLQNAVWDLGPSATALSTRRTARSARRCSPTAPDAARLRRRDPRAAAAHDESVGYAWTSSMATMFGWIWQIRV